MKKLKVVMITIAVILLAASVAYAASYANIGITAQVPNNSPQLSVIIKELTSEGQEPWTGTTVTAMDFGELTHTNTDSTDAGVWFSQKYFCVFIFTTSYGNRYEVKSTCKGLTSGANTLPTGSFMLTPGYTKDDEWSKGNAQGEMPTNAVLGDASSAVKTDQLVYRSETAGTNRIIRAFYSLPSYKSGGADPYDGYEPIKLDQPAGTYSGTVTISIAAI
ncbi:MAG: hypothetical protein WC559_06190 [Candidatus Omnitrophota bacterium]